VNERRKRNRQDRRSFRDSVSRLTLKKRLAGRPKRKRERKMRAVPHLLNKMEINQTRSRSRSWLQMNSYCLKREIRFGNNTHLKLSSLTRHSCNPKHSAIIRVISAGTEYRT
jgi:hypothetical protein